MDPFERFRLGVDHDEVKAAWRRQVWREIYLPLAIGIFLVLMMIALIWWSQTGNASVWADISLVLLMIAAIVFGFVGLVILVVITVGVIYLIVYVPPPLESLRETAYQARDAAAEASEAAAKPIILPQAAAYAVTSGIRYLAGIFRG